RRRRKPPRSRLTTKPQSRCLSGRAELRLFRRRATTRNKANANSPPIKACVGLDALLRSRGGRFRLKATAPAPLSGRKPEMHHVAILNDVVLAFQAHLAGIARSCLAAIGDEIVVGDGLGANEALLEIGMDDASSLGRLCAGGHGPGPRLLRSDGEER